MEADTWDTGSAGWQFYTRVTIQGWGRVDKFGREDEEFCFEYLSWSSLTYSDGDVQEGVTKLVQNEIKGRKSQG